MLAQNNISLKIEFYFEGSKCHSFRLLEPVKYVAMQQDFQWEMGMKCRNKTQF